MNQPAEIHRQTEESMRLRLEALAEDLEARRREEEERERHLNRFRAELLAKSYGRIVRARKDGPLTGGRVLAMIAAAYDSGARAATAYERDRQHCALNARFSDETTPSTPSTPSTHKPE